MVNSRHNWGDEKTQKKKKKITGVTRPGKSSAGKAGLDPGTAALEADTS